MAKRLVFSQEVNEKVCIYLSRLIAVEGLEGGGSASE